MKWHTEDWEIQRSRRDLFASGALGGLASYLANPKRAAEIAFDFAEAAVREMTRRNRKEDRRKRARELYSRIRRKLVKNRGPKRKKR